MTICIVLAKKMYSCPRNARRNKYNDARIWSAPKCYIVGSRTQTSGWNEPFETDSRRTRNMLSRCMNPSPISHRLWVDPSMGYDLCGSVGEQHQTRNFTTTRTYSHQAQVLLDLPGDQVCECAACDRVAFLVPVLCRNLLWQSMRDNTTGKRVPTWAELLDRYPGNLRWGQFLHKAQVITINVPTTGRKCRCACLVTPVHPVRRDP